MPHEVMTADAASVRRLALNILRVIVFIFYTAGRGCARRRLGDCANLAKCCRYYKYPADFVCKIICVCGPGQGYCDAGRCDAGRCDGRVCGVCLFSGAPASGDLNVAEYCWDEIPPVEAVEG